MTWIFPLRPWTWYSRASSRLIFFIVMAGAILPNNRGMIVASGSARHLVITQPDHARFSAELLSLWRALADHPRREELLFAVREHDNGWRETDAAPHWDAEQGRPHDFLSLPRTERIELWQRGTARFA